MNQTDRKQGKIRGLTQKPKPRITQEEQAPTDDQNEVLQRAAHERIDQLFAEARRGKFHGKIGLEVSFENGTAKHVRRHFEGTDR